MKYPVSLLGMFLLFLFSACSKTGSDGGGGTIPRDTVVITPPPVGRTIVTKVMGTTENAAVFDTAGGVLTLTRLGISNIYTGNGNFDNSSKGLTISLRNPGTTSTYLYGSTPKIKFPNALKKDPAQITAATLAGDTASTVAMIEINGFDFAATGFDRLLVPLCEVAGTDNSGTIGNTNQYPLSLLTDARIKAAFPAKLAAVKVNIAPKF